MHSASESKQRAYYDRIAGTYDEHHGSDHGLAYRARVFDRLFAGRALEGVRVLDALCGGGQSSAYFAARGAQVTGVDISAEQCEHYRRRFPGGIALCRSALDTGLADASFDLVITDSLHHLHPDVDAGVAELTRVLRPGGSLVIWEPAGGSLLDHARRLWYRLDPRFFADNEAAIDVDRLGRDQVERLRIERVEYGGNVGYLLVAMSMAMRIPVGWVGVYARPVLRVEEALSRFQGKLTSLWVLAELVKRR
jgi:SAM-dependent methyltransferase